MQWINVTVCPVCGFEPATVYGKGYAPLVAFTEFLGGAPLAVVTNYLQCTNCGLIYQSPRLDDAGLNELYASGDYRRMLNMSQPDIDKDELARQDRIAPLIKSPGRHLDIGCSRGYLLDISQRAGRTVLGVEPNAKYTMQGIDTVPVLDDVTGEWYTITCLHVMEHVSDPVGFANKIISLLAPGGRLILEVPSENSKGGPLRLWHLYLFMPPVIMRLFEGLKLVEFSETPHYQFIFEK